jgi:alkanesulfonate monooxygenase SsuD/methylene tetrahydromethanopterin reductase-like flavin-dependent oxidoreductase (luciferase family)
MHVRIGIGLPAAVPDVVASVIGHWATLSEGLGFRSIGVIDRLVYDNVDPLIALTAAAAGTERVELVTTVVNVVWRHNAILLAKQLASLDQVSGRRLTAGLALGGWPEDYAVSGVQLSKRGAQFDHMLASMRRVWRGEIAGAGGPMPAQPEGRPRIQIGGLAPQSFMRVATFGEGWVAPSFGLEPTYVDAVRRDTATSLTGLESQLSQLSNEGCDDVVLLPCTGGLDQVESLAGALDALGVKNDEHGRRIS